MYSTRSPAFPPACCFPGAQFSGYSFSFGEVGFFLILSLCLVPVKRHAFFLVSPVLLATVQFIKFMPFVFCQIISEFCAILTSRRGALIIRRLCVLLDAERVYREFSTILEGEADLDFASTMVQV